MKLYQIVLIVLVVLALLAVGYIQLYNRLQKLRIKVEEAGAGIDVALEKRFDLLSEQIEAVKKYLDHEYKTFTGVSALRSGTAQEEKLQERQQRLSEEALQTIDRQIAQQTQKMEQIKRQLEQNAFSNQGILKRKMPQSSAKEAMAASAAGREQTVQQRIRFLASAHQSLTQVGSGIDALMEQYPMLQGWKSIENFQKSAVNAEEHLQAARRLYNSNVSLYNQALLTIPWSWVAALCHMQKADFYEIEENKRTFTAKFD